MATRHRIANAGNEFQHAEVLKRNRTTRHRHREIFVEGVKPLNRLVEYGWPVKSFWFSHERPLSEWAKDLLRACPAEHHYELPDALMAQLSDRDEPSELVAVVGMPDDDLSRITMTQDSLVVVFDRPSSPGNLGTLVRSCDALGGTAFVYSGHSADAYDPQAIRASVGSVFAIPVVHIEGPAVLASWLSGHHGRSRIIGTDSAGTTPLHEADLARPLLVIAGNEAAGMSNGYAEMCSEVVRVPMRGSADSMNVAVATSILLYEAERRRIS